MTLSREHYRAMFSACTSFRGAHWTAQMWATARMANAPLAALGGDLMALQGRLLSVGCGFGVVERYVTLRNPSVEIVGFELDQRRVDAAATTQTSAGSVVVCQADVTTLGDVGVFDGALAMDVLHHLEPNRQVALIKTLAGLVRPGGDVIVKDIATTPRWKHAFNATHDLLAAGDTTHCRAPAAMAEALSTGGLEVEDWRRLGRFSPYPHYVIKARVPIPHD